MTISTEGRVDSGQIAVNLAGHPGDEQRALLAEAMSELIFMACMAARRDFGDSDSLALVQQAQEIAMRIQQLKKRKSE